jgi:2-polyprenyl-6-methoxyphenol hydroxylase-like FAD-dependent oxidoreductase
VAGQQPAAQVLHRLRGVAANLGAADVARLTAAAEAVLHDGAADSLAMPAALSRLEQALELVVRTARNLQHLNRKKFRQAGAGRTDATTGALHALLQNNNLKALELFRALRPALAPPGRRRPGEAVDTLNFKAARLIVEQMLQRKESA